MLLWDSVKLFFMFLCITIVIFKPKSKLGESEGLPSSLQGLKEMWH